MEIKLGGKRGGVALVSKEDYEKVSQDRWYYNKNGYAHGTVNNKRLLMHRFIMDPPDDKIIDHINHNRLDNRRENLRILCIPKNNGNKSKSKNKSSKYKNVHFDKKKDKFCVQISVNGKTFHLGYYDDEVKGAETVDKYIVHNKLDHIDLNFPDKREEYLKECYIQPKTQNKSSEYEGVQKRYAKYATVLYLNGKNIYLLTSDDPIECAKKYDEYIVKNNIKSKKLNFPENYPDYETREIKTKYIVIDENTVQLIIPNDNRIVTIDKNDYELIKYYKCHIEKKQGYVKLSKDRKCVFLHRFLFNEYNPKIFIDHIDSNPLNNTRNNLRLSNVQKNGQNKKKKDNTSSKYNGVHYCNRYMGWISRIYMNKKVIFYIFNRNEMVAVRKRDLFLIDHPELHYKKNFIWDENEIKIWKEYFNMVK